MLDAGVRLRRDAQHAAAVVVREDLGQRPQAFLGEAVDGPGADAAVEADIGAPRVPGVELLLEVARTGEEARRLEARLEEAVMTLDDPFGFRIPRGAQVPGDGELAAEGGEDLCRAAAAGVERALTVPDERPREAADADQAAQQAREDVRRFLAEDERAGGDPRIAERHGHDVSSAGLAEADGDLAARLWNDVFNWAQDQLGIPRGTIKATVLVEVVTAAFEMDEILYELRDHSGGLNAGRWDYIFSLIKKFPDRPEYVLPDRIQVTMTVPFMRAYTELLVQTCHKRGAFALGGMAAFIPSRRDPEVNEKALAKVRDDKVREANDGFDGTWVAHPDLVETAMTEFDKKLGDKRNQLERQRPEVSVKASDLLDIHVPGGTITDAGVRANVSVGIQYIASWLRGTGAAAINNLMEDAATAEISRSQVWQWVRHGASIEGGPKITADLIRTIQKEELEKIRKTIGADFYAKGMYEEAAKLFEEVALSKDFVEFLTLPGYDHLA